ncbi:lipocalin family protein [Aequorivita nionensis]|uniref:lipocalin family protein n=1 Tax=Aequorivita nionensis TaxID=1287690 RepID=UPI003965CAB8
MKPYKSLKTTILFLAITTLLSCNNDEKNSNTDQAKNLIGVWQRSDFSEEYDYKLYFNTEGNGYSTEYIAQPDGTAISNLRPFSWSSSENTLTLDYDDGATDATPFSINAAGQLLASGLGNVPFNKL